MAPVRDTKQWWFLEIYISEICALTINSEAADNTTEHYIVYFQQSQYDGPGGSFIWST